LDRHAPIPARAVINLQAVNVLPQRELVTMLIGIFEQSRECQSEAVRAAHIPHGRNCSKPCEPLSMGEQIQDTDDLNG